MAVHVSRVLRQGGGDQERQSLLSLYQRALNRSRRGGFWSSLLGWPRRLFDLKEIETRCLVGARSYAGLRVVPIDDIRGSEGRTSDFDCEFYPLQSHTQERWLRVAAARRRGKALPPVALIQVGNLYFVQDGHHRLSVARALGQKSIEASVVVWQVAGPLPWSVAAQVTDPWFRGLINWLRRRVQLQGGLPGVHGLIAEVGAALRHPALPQPGIDTL